jgi:anti-sigma regulatory factor (Ser/Thr protein kinase)
MDFRPHETVVGLARREVRDTLTRWGCCGDDIDNAVLVCSELATNVVRYAATPCQDFEVRLSATAYGTEVLVEVTDTCDAPPPRSPATGPDDENGRGLLLVNTLAHEVGHRERMPTGKTVWARLLLTGPVA